MRLDERVELGVRNGNWKKNLIYEYVHFIPKFVNRLATASSKIFCKWLTHENFIARLFSAGSMVGLSRSDRPATSKEAMPHHALPSRRKRTTKMTTNRNLPIRTAAIFVLAAGRIRINCHQDCVSRATTPLA